tara:strand:- start:1437 stop:2141 length:705 start_codon:yes stop_codon:yes gene_type:complete
MLVSIIIPAYNEKNHIIEIINNIIEKVNYKTQIIVVDDFSDDGTTEILKVKLASKIDEIVYHKKNLGKGAAIKSSLPFIKGDVVAIQDADLEYDPIDLNNLISLIVEGKTNVAYGSRVLGKLRYTNKNFISKFRILGNHMLTTLSNLLNNQNLTDAHTCYKVFKVNIFRKLKLKENDFAFCPEVTTKISLLNEKIIELPINYNGRSVAEGKKIRAYDSIRAIFTLLKYRFSKFN